MSSPEKKPFSIVSLVIDLIMLWGGLTAGCLSGVFWLALQMFKVVYKFQRESRK